MELLRYPYRADPGTMLLTIVFFSASTGVIGWVLITGTGAWFTEVLFVVSLPSWSWAIWA